MKGRENGYGINNLITGRTHRDENDECRGPRPLGKTSVFGANPAGKEGEERERRRHCQGADKHH